MTDLTITQDEHTVTIEGIRFAKDVFRYLADPGRNELGRFTRDDDTVIIEVVARVVTDAPAGQPLAVEWLRQGGATITFGEGGPWARPDFGTPDDYMDPPWDTYEKIHCWRNYATAEVKSQWMLLPVPWRLMVSRMLQMVADREVWD
ncbi:MAG: hypothetical protein KDB18_05730 [Salinibacterium sp.]|nr:hypothetical protein [Salinibacterium sp.]